MRGVVFTDDRRLELAEMPDPAPRLLDVGAEPICVKAHCSGIARKVMGRVSGGQEVGSREAPEGRVRRRSSP